MIKFLSVLTLCALIFNSFTTEAVPINSDDLYRSSLVRKLTLSPTGDYLAYWKSDDEGQFIYIESTKDLVEIDKIDVGAKKVYLSSYDWLSPQKLLVNMRVDRKKVLYIADFSSGQVKLTKIKTNGYLLSALPEDSEHLLFVSPDADSDQYFHLHYLTYQQLRDNQLSSDTEIKLSSDSPVFFYFDDTTQDIFSVAANIDAQQLEISIHSKATKAWRFLTKIDFDTDYTFYPISLIGSDTLAILTNLDSDKVVLRSLDIRTQEIGDIIYQHPQYDLTDATLTETGEIESVRYIENGVSKTNYLLEHKDAITAEVDKQYPSFQHAVVAESTDANWRLLALYHSASPVRYILQNVAEGTYQELADPYPTLRQYEYSRTEVLNVTTDDNLHIEGYLNRPLDNDIQTLIVMPHGGPISVRDYDSFNRDIQYYTSRGFSVLRVNFRGSSGFGKAYMQAGREQFGKIIEDDITAVVDVVNKKYRFKHHCALGSSYGGYSSAILAIRQPERYRCVVSYFGVFDLPLLFNQSNIDTTEEARESVAYIVGDYENKQQFISPVKLYAQLQAPILLIAGQLDSVASIEHSNRFKYVLKRTGHDVEFDALENTYHGFNTWSGDQFGVARGYDFMMQKLGIAYPDPKDLTKHARDALANDFSTLYDAYHFKDRVPNNEEKADRYIQLARDFQHPRSTFNYGVNLLNEDDSTEAISYIKQSDELGYTKSLHRLGRLYGEGKFVEKNEQLSNEYYQRSFEKYKYWRSGVFLAGNSCYQAEDTYDVNQCLEILKDLTLPRSNNTHDNTLRDQIKSYTSHILVTEKLTEAQQTLVKEMFTRSYGKTGFDITISNPEVKIKNYKWFTGSKTSTEPVVEDSISYPFSTMEWKYDAAIAGFSQGAFAVRVTTTHPDGETELQKHGISVDSKGRWTTSATLGAKEGKNIFTLELLDFNQDVIYRSTVILHYAP